MISARKLVASDAKALREVRLETLAHYGDLFACSYAIEQSKPLTYWRDQAKETCDRCYFGLFDGPKLIGLNAGRVWEENPSLALGWSSFIKLDYRGKGHSKKLWDLRGKWIKNKGLRGVIFYMLGHNTRGIDIIKKRGAVHVFDRPLSFDGGPPSLFHWYQLKIG